MIYMEVNPIKNLKDIEKIKRYLLKMDNKRNYCLFVVGINVGLRISDLLSLKLNDVFNFKEWTAKDEFVIKEQKTDKLRKVKLKFLFRLFFLKQKIFLEQKLRGYQVRFKTKLKVIFRNFLI